MIDAMAANLAAYIIKNGGDAKNQEVYEYSISSFLGSLLTYTAILLVAWFFKLFPDILLFLGFFLPLRYCIGGMHANTRAGCFVLSVVITITLLLILPYLGKWLLLPVPIFAIATVFAIAPVVNPNHPLSEAYVNKVKKVARLIIVAECVVLALICFRAGYIYYNMGAIGMLTATVSAILAYFKGKLVKLS